MRKSDECKKIYKNWVDLTCRGYERIYKNMTKKYVNSRKNKREMLRKVFFADVDEFRRRVVGDYVLVNYWSKTHKMWEIAGYKTDDYLKQFNEEEQKKLNLEQVEIVSKGVVNLYDYVTEGPKS